jgi:hypothetical protein
MPLSSGRSPPAPSTRTSTRRAALVERSDQPVAAAAPSDHLDDLSSAERHRRAVDLARSRQDARYFWRLLEHTPAGRDHQRPLREGPGATSSSSRRWVDDAIDRDGKLDTALRLKSAWRSRDVG